MRVCIQGVWESFISTLRICIELININKKNSYLLTMYFENLKGFWWFESSKFENLQIIFYNVRLKCFIFALDPVSQMILLG